jgi:4-diphosphocytidyl-2-C-methyl-D-erythritol kinase
MQPISLHDEILLDAGRGDGIALLCEPDDLTAGPENLAYRAAEHFLRQTGLKRSVQIQLTKRIPIGAGLGGGSSNAAAVLTALNEILETGLDEPALMAMGASLGSDVPFFILRGPALASGRGERLERVSIPALHYVLINPGFAVSTAWVYGNYTPPADETGNPNLGPSQGPKPGPNLWTRDALEKHLQDPAAIRDILVNDLESVTEGRYPEISTLKRHLLKSGAMGALMSGSGPTVFGVFHDGISAQRAFLSLSETMARENPQAVLFLTQGVLSD